MEIHEIFGEVPRPATVPTKSAIYVWGYNQRGQTGRKETDRSLRIPRQLPPELFGCPTEKGAVTPTRWLDVACGREHTAAVASDGSLFTWGANDFGQLGDGTEENIKHPKKVKHLESEFVRSVSCGANCTAAIAEPRQSDGTISKTGRLWVWGQNQGSDNPRLFWGAFAPNTVIRQVSCGAVHAMALSDDGFLQAWGYNEYGQLGRGVTCEGLQGPRVISGYAKHLDEAPELVKINQVSCGEYHTAAISEDGEMNNASTELGVSFDRLELSANQQKNPAKTNWSTTSCPEKNNQNLLSFATNQQKNPAKTNSINSLFYLPNGNHCNDWLI